MVLLSRRLNLFIGDMCNRKTCPLQARRHSALKQFIQGYPQSAKVTHVPISPFLLVLEVWHVKPISRKSWGGNLLMWSDLTLGLLQGQAIRQT